MKFTGLTAMGLMGCALALPHGPHHIGPQPSDQPTPSGPPPPPPSASDFDKRHGFERRQDFGIPTGLPFSIPSGFPTSLPSGLPGFGGFGEIGKRQFAQPSGLAPSGLMTSGPAPSVTHTGFSQPSGSFPNASGVPVGFPPSGDSFNERGLPPFPEPSGPVPSGPAPSGPPPSGSAPAGPVPTARV
ncbi:uncharacterized protein N7458_000755 [Penicillium daleae]|uniref:Uncharacterized protein n=1 Tax=Penicillium daleae TaxID=63821 RepID=A0AAD6CJF7_9EURO|nr:uncharacterized protein N7458_000755 [Penicillium daleae]KAJ5465069.1 hypothetical protein N7458_000755 [Penicillium daleae]